MPPGDALDAAALADEFAQAARRYSVLVEGDLPDARAVFIVRVREALADLYLHGVRLPAVEPDDTEWGPDEAAFATWQLLYERLSSYLGDVNTYWEVFDPYERSEPVSPALADDLADVVTDLQPGLEYAAKGFIHSALWDWRWRFWFHWGHHAVDALRALTRLAPDDVDASCAGRAEP